MASRQPEKENEASKHSDRKHLSASSDPPLGKMVPVDSRLFDRMYDIEEHRR